MTINLNSRLYDRLPEPVDALQRAVYYGDGLLESMCMFQGRIPLWDKHWARLHAGLHVFGYELPPGWDAGFMLNEIHKVASNNARIRLIVWRSPGGLYLPEGNLPQFMLTATELPFGSFQWLDQGITLGLSRQVRLAADAFSGFKTLNALRYVAGIREARANDWDDAVLLNALERVCEATSSNIFWWEAGQLYTVPLTEGCVAGVMRSAVLEKAGYAVQEKPVTFAALCQADEIFLTNAVRGIIPVRIFAGKLLANLKTKMLFDTLAGRL